MKGHVYVPIRFVAEYLGATIDYDAELHKIFVKNSELDLTDLDYEGKYEVVEAVNAVSGTERLDFIDIANKEYAGVIFSILIWSKEDWKISSLSMLEIGQIYRIGEDGDKVFTLNPPGDVNYNPNDAELTATYRSMSKQINKIRITFKLIN